MEVGFAWRSSSAASCGKSQQPKGWLTRSVFCVREDDCLEIGPSFFISSNLQIGTEPKLSLCKRSITITTLLLLLPFGLVACGGPDQEHPSDGANGDSAEGLATTLAIVSNEPAEGTMGFPLNGPISATFSEAIDVTTLTASTFTLTVGTPGVPVEGIVTFQVADSTAVFMPAANLAGETTFTATITTGVKSVSGAVLPAPHSWTFTTGTTVLGVPVNLRTAGNYAVFSKQSISGTGAMVTGDLGISPSRASLITGFALSTPATEFTTSAQVIGKVYARDYLPPTPATLVTAVSDLQQAITEATTRTPTVVVTTAVDLGGMTVAAGIYNYQTVTITSDVTLAGSATDVWIFQIAGTLGMTAAMKVVLSGGALPKNVFWQVTGATTIGANTQFNGVMLSTGAVTSGASALITGRLLSQDAITITDAVVVQPAP